MQTIMSNAKPCAPAGEASGGGSLAPAVGARPSTLGAGGGRYGSHFEAVGFDELAEVFVKFGVVGKLGVDRSLVWRYGWARSDCDDHRRMITISFKIENIGIL